MAESESDDSLLALDSDDDDNVSLLSVKAAKSTEKSASTSVQSAQKTVQKTRGRPCGSKDQKPRKKAKTAVKKQLFEHDAAMDVDGAGQEIEPTTRLKMRQVENLPRTGLYEVEDRKSVV